MKKVNLRKGRRLAIIKTALDHLRDNEKVGNVTREEAAKLLNLLKAEEPAAYYGVTIEQYLKDDDLQHAWYEREVFDITD